MPTAGIWATHGCLSIYISIYMYIYIKRNEGVITNPIIYIYIKIDESIWYNCVKSNQKCF